MQRPWTIAAALGMAAMTMTASPAAAQLVGRPFRFGVQGGASIPTGDLSNASKTGWNAGVLLDIGLPLVPIGFRLDGSWNQFGKKSTVDGDIKNRIIDGTANVTYTFGPALPTKFYLIGGVGIYNLKTTIDNAPILTSTGAGFGSTASVSGSETKFGVNGGAGVRFQLTGFSTFIEGRFHSVFTSGSHANFIPVTVGITF